MFRITSSACVLNSVSINDNEKEDSSLDLFRSDNITLLIS